VPYADVVTTACLVEPIQHPDVRIGQLADVNVVADAGTSGVA
jgi:hypothetical protein